MSSNKNRMLTKPITFIFFITICFASFGQSSDSLQTTTKDTFAYTANSQYVIFSGDTLFSISTNLGPYSAKHRTVEINKQLAILASDTKINADSFSIKKSNSYYIIYYKDFLLMSISNADAQKSGKQQDQLAKEYLSIIKSKTSNSQIKRSTSYWVRNISYTLLTLIGLFLIFYFIKRLFRLIDNRLLEYEKGLKRKRKTVFRYLAPKGPDYFFLFLSRIVRIILSAIILFFYLPLLFSFLPWTQGIVNKFYVFVSEPLAKILSGLKDFVVNHLIYIVIIYFIARYLLQILKFVAHEVEEDKLKLNGFHKDWARPTYNIIRILIYAFALVFIFPHLPGSESDAFKGVSIFLGILFSLGSTSAIANIVAGIVITYMRPFQIGDRVKINNTIGDIVEKNLLVTRLKTIKNEDITIPNSTIINTHLMNFSKNASMGIILHTSVTIGYDIPSETVIRLLLQAAKNTKNLTRSPKPFVLQKSLNDFYVEYELNVYTKQPEKMALFYSDIHNSILNEFNSAGIEILSPHYSALRDGNPSTIPSVDEPESAKIAKNVVNSVVDKLTGKE